MDDSLVLRKPTGTIHISNPFTFGERKLFNTLICHAQTENGLSQARYDIALDDVYKALGWKNNKNDDDLKDYVKSLLSTVIEWNEFGIDNSVAWKACQFLSSGEISKKRLRYRINPEIVAQVKRPALYAKMVLLVQTQLKKKHSLVLYEYIQDEISRSSDKLVEIKDVSISFLLNLLGQKSDYYGQYKYLNKDILKPSVNEINNHTDVNVHYKAVRQGRKTTGIDFTVMRQESFQLSLNLENDNNKCNDPSLTDQLKNILQHHGISQNIALKLSAKYSPERIRGNIQHLENEIECGKEIKNRAAWLRRAIEEDWQPKKSTAEVANEKQRKKIASERIKKEQDKLKQEALEKAFSDFRYECTKAKFFEKSKSFQTRRRKAFLEKMQEERNETLLRFYNRDGWKSPILDGIFFSELMSELLTEKHEISIVDFAVWQKEAV